MTSALSLSNISPLIHQSPRRNPGRPALPRILSKPNINNKIPEDQEPLHPELYLDDDAQTVMESPFERTVMGDDSNGQVSPISSDATSGSSAEDAGPSSTYKHESRQPSWPGEKLTISERDKLVAIIDEFGEFASNMENGDGSPSESERLLADSHGSLFK